MSNNNGSGFHKFTIWATENIPGMALFLAVVIVLAGGEFIDGIQGKGCNTSIDFVTSPQSVWLKGGCIVNNVRQVIPSRSENSTNNTAP